MEVGLGLKYTSKGLFAAVSGMGGGGEKRKDQTSIDLLCCLLLEFYGLRILSYSYSIFFVFTTDYGFPLLPDKIRSFFILPLMVVLFFCCLKVRCANGTLEDDLT